MERKLAHIEEVLAVEPIANSDNLERLTILGWQVVAKKGEFKVEDLVVYIEVDSLLPEKPEFEFLRSKHFRIKTVRLRGQISQGIAFPCSILPEESSAGNYTVGDDVTELLGITKYEPPIPVHLSGEVKGNFPSWLVKTDEMRIQAVPEVLTRHPEKIFLVTEKLDGTSVTIYLRDGEFGICSRNLELKESEGNTYWQVARKLNIEEKLRSAGTNICLQGELIGPGIQDNKYNLTERTIFFFNVFDIDTFSFRDVLDSRNFIESLGLSNVPVVSSSYLLPGQIEDLLVHATGTSLLNPSTPWEGLVFRPWQEARDPELGRLSFKLINPEFLLKYE